MKPTEILYEPTSIRRIGVRKNSELVFGLDYSCLAYMLEEYISYGIFSIVLPSSSPEKYVIDNIPDLVKKRIKIVDDQKEREAVVRLLHGLRKEFNIEISEDEGRLTFPSDIDSETKEHIKQIHDDVKRLAFGFNHGVYIELNTEYSANSMREIRNKLNNHNSRAILSYIEGILAQYEPISFGSIVPKDNNPKSLISIFDRLLNDPDYTTFSLSMSKLSNAETRQKTLLELREFVRRVSSARLVGTAWDYIIKVLKVWPGIPLPESKDFAAAIGGRSIPTTVDLTEPRSRAVENWFSYAKENPPLRRDGREIFGGEEHIQWLPLRMIPKNPHSHDFEVGEIDELIRVLDGFKKNQVDTNSS
jgi:hypothetical protein